MAKRTFICLVLVLAITTGISLTSDFLPAGFHTPVLLIGLLLQVLLFWYPVDYCMKQHIEYMEEQKKILGDYNPRNDIYTFTKYDL